MDHPTSPTDPEFDGIVFKTHRPSDATANPFDTHHVPSNAALEEMYKPIEEQQAHQHLVSSKPPSRAMTPVPQGTVTPPEPDTLEAEPGVNLQARSPMLRPHSPAPIQINSPALSARDLIDTPPETAALDPEPMSFDKSSDEGAEFAPGGVKTPTSTDENENEVEAHETTPHLGNLPSHGPRTEYEWEHKSKPAVDNQPVPEAALEHVDKNTLTIPQNDETLDAETALPPTHDELKHSTPSAAPSTSDESHIITIPVAGTVPEEAKTVHVPSVAEVGGKEKADVEDVIPTSEKSEVADTEVVPAFDSTKEVEPTPAEVEKDVEPSAAEQVEPTHSAAYEAPIGLGLSGVTEPEAEETAKTSDVEPLEKEEYPSGTVPEKDVEPAEGDDHNSKILGSATIGAAVAGGAALFGLKHKTDEETKETPAAAETDAPETAPEEHHASTRDFYQAPAPAEAGDHTEQPIVQTGGITIGEDPHFYEKDELKADMAKFEDISPETAHEEEPLIHSHSDSIPPTADEECAAIAATTVESDADSSAVVAQFPDTLHLTQEPLTTPGGHATSANEEEKELIEATNVKNEIETDAPEPAAEGYSSSTIESAKSVLPSSVFERAERDAPASEKLTNIAMNAAPEGVTEELEKDVPVSEKLTGAATAILPAALVSHAQKDTPLTEQATETAKSVLPQSLVSSEPAVTAANPPTGPAPTALVDGSADDHLRPQTKSVKEESSESAVTVTSPPAKTATALVDTAITDEHSHPSTSTEDETPALSEQATESAYSIIPEPISHEIQRDAPFSEKATNVASSILPESTKETLQEDKPATEKATDLASSILPDSATSDEPPATAKEQVSSSGLTGLLAGGLAAVGLGSAAAVVHSLNENKEELPADEDVGLSGHTKPAAEDTIQSTGVEPLEKKAIGVPDETPAGLGGDTEPQAEETIEDTKVEPLEKNHTSVYGQIYASPATLADGQIARKLSTSGANRPVGITRDVKAESAIEEDDLEVVPSKPSRKSKPSTEETIQTPNAPEKDHTSVYGQIYASPATLADGQVAHKLSTGGASRPIGLTRDIKAESAIGENDIDITPAGLVGKSEPAAEETIKATEVDPLQRSHTSVYGQIYASPATLADGQIARKLSTSGASRPTNLTRDVKAESAINEDDGNIASVGLAGKSEPQAEEVILSSEVDPLEKPKDHTSVYGSIYASPATLADGQVARKLSMTGGSRPIGLTRDTKQESAIDEVDDHTTGKALGSTALGAAVAGTTAYLGLKDNTSAVGDSSTEKHAPEPVGLADSTEPSAEKTIDAAEIEPLEKENVQTTFATPANLRDGTVGFVGLAGSEPAAGDIHKATAIEPLEEPVLAEKEAHPKTDTDDVKEPLRLDSIAPPAEETTMESHVDPLGKSSIAGDEPEFKEETARDALVDTSDVQGPIGLGGSASPPAEKTIMESHVDPLGKSSVAGDEQDLETPAAVESKKDKEDVQKNETILGSAVLGAAVTGTAAYLGLKDDKEEETPVHHTPIDLATSTEPEAKETIEESKLAPLEPGTEAIEPVGLAGSTNPETEDTATTSAIEPLEKEATSIKHLALASDSTHDLSSPPALEPQLAPRDLPSTSNFQPLELNHATEDADVSHLHQVDAIPRAGTVLDREVTDPSEVPSTVSAAVPEDKDISHLEQVDAIPAEGTHLEPEESTLSEPVTTDTDLSAPIEHKSITAPKEEETPASIEAPLEQEDSYYNSDERLVTLPSSIATAPFVPVEEELEVKGDHNDKDLGEFAALAGGAGLVTAGGAVIAHEMHEHNEAKTDEDKPEIVATPNELTQSEEDSFPKEVTEDSEPAFEDKSNTPFTSSEVEPSTKSHQITKDSTSHARDVLPEGLAQSSTGGIPTDIASTELPTTEGLAGISKSVLPSSLAGEDTTDPTIVEQTDKSSLLGDGVVPHATVEESVPVTEQATEAAKSVLPKTVTDEVEKDIPVADKIGNVAKAVLPTTIVGESSVSEETVSEDRPADVPYGQHPIRTTSNDMNIADFNQSTPSTAFGTHDLPRDTGDSQAEKAIVPETHEESVPVTEQATDVAKRVLPDAVVGYLESDAPISEKATNIANEVVPDSFYAPAEAEKEGTGPTSYVAAGLGALGLGTAGAEILHNEPQKSTTEEIVKPEAIIDDTEVALVYAENPSSVEEPALVDSELVVETPASNLETITESTSHEIAPETVLNDAEIAPAKLDEGENVDPPALVDDEVVSSTAPVEHDTLVDPLVHKPAGLTAPLPGSEDSSFQTLPTHFTELKDVLGKHEAPVATEESLPVEDETVPEVKPLEDIIAQQPTEREVVHDSEIPTLDEIMKEQPSSAEVAKETPAGPTLDEILEKQPTGEEIATEVEPTHVSEPVDELQPTVEETPDAFTAPNVVDEPSLKLEEGAVLGGLGVLGAGAAIAHHVEHKPCEEVPEESTTAPFTEISTKNPPAEVLDFENGIVPSNAALEPSPLDKETPLVPNSLASIDSEPALTPKLAKDAVADSDPFEAGQPPAATEPDLAVVDEEKTSLPEELGALHAQHEETQPLLREVSRSEIEEPITTPTVDDVTSVEPVESVIPEVSAHDPTANLAQPTIPLKHDIGKSPLSQELDPETLEDSAVVVPSAIEIPVAKPATLEESAPKDSKTEESYHSTVAKIVAGGVGAIGLGAAGEKFLDKHETDQSAISASDQPASSRDLNEPSVAEPVSKSHMEESSETSKAEHPDYVHDLLTKLKGTSATATDNSEEALVTREAEPLSRPTTERVDTTPYILDVPLADPSIAALVLSGNEDEHVSTSLSNEVEPNVSSKTQAVLAEPSSVNDETHISEAPVIAAALAETAPEAIAASHEETNDTAPEASHGFVPPVEETKSYEPEIEPTVADPTTIMSSQPGKIGDTIELPPAGSGQGLVFDDELARELDAGYEEASTTLPTHDEVTPVLAESTTPLEAKPTATHFKDVEPTVSSDEDQSSSYGKAATLAGALGLTAGTYGASKLYGQQSSEEPSTERSIGAQDEVIAAPSVATNVLSQLHQPSSDVSVTAQNPTHVEEVLKDLQDPTTTTETKDTAPDNFIGVAPATSTASSHSVHSSDKSIKSLQEIIHDHEIAPGVASTSAGPPVFHTTPPAIEEGTPVIYTSNPETLAKQIPGSTPVIEPSTGQPAIAITERDGKKHRKFWEAFLGIFLFGWLGSLGRIFKKKVD